MEHRTLTLGHSPDPDDAFMFYGLAKGLIPTHGFRFEHVLQDIQTLNERATRGELDISAISIHAYAYVSDQYALLPSGASLGDGYGPMLVAKQKFSKEEIARKKIAVPGTMTSAFLALQLWLGDASPRNSKSQSPDSRETPNSKLQTWITSSCRSTRFSKQSARARRRSASSFTKASSPIRTKGWSCAKTSVRGGAAKMTACLCPWAAT